MKQVIFPDSIIQFDSWVFSNTSIVSMKIPAKLNRTGLCSFEGLTTLKNVDFSNAKLLIEIFASTFHSCVNLEKIDLRNCNKLKQIKDNAFANCISLTSVLLPDHFNSIEFYQNSFLSCTSLTTLFSDDSFRKFNFPLTAFTGCEKLQIQAIFGELPTHYCFSDIFIDLILYPMIVL